MQTCVMARSLAEGWNNQGVRHLRVPALLNILVSVLFFELFWRSEHFRKYNFSEPQRLCNVDFLGSYLGWIVVCSVHGICVPGQRAI